ncbi:MAG: calcium/sodium antiporter [Actinomycetota bacterium]
MTAALELIGGLVGLVVSGTAIVRGASTIGRRLGLSPLVIGLTIVAAGTSAPELAVVWQAANKGDSGIAMGSVVGSNIANILLVLGIVAVINAIDVTRQAITLDAPVMIGASVLVLVLGLDDAIGRVDGIVLVACLVAYITTTIVVSRRATVARAITDVTATDAVTEAMTNTGPEATTDTARSSVQVGATRAVQETFDQITSTFVGAVALFAVGAVGVAVSARFVVSGAGSLAISWGMSEVVVGLTVVAIGTSAPEIATSVIAATRGESDVALGNAIGSNVFNLLFVLGLVSATTVDLPVAESIRQLDLPIMLAVAVLALPYAVTRLSIDRSEGAMFLVIYVAYTVYLVLDGTENDASSTYGVVAIAILAPLSLAVFVASAIRRRAPAG